MLKTIKLQLFFSKFLQNPFPFGQSTLCLGGHFTLLPNQFKNVFGDQATRLYSICFSFSGISGICEIVIQLYVLTDNNLTLFFYIYSLLAAVSLVLLVFWYDPTPYKRQ